MLAFISVGKHLLSRSTFALHNQGNDYITLNRARGQIEAMTTAVLALTRHWHRAALQQAQLCRNEKEWGKTRNDKRRGEKNPNQQTRNLDWQPQRKKKVHRTSKFSMSWENWKCQHNPNGISHTCSLILFTLKQPTKQEWDVTFFCLGHS